MKDLSLPLLRSPPFPLVGHETAAVSRTRTPTQPAAPPDDAALARAEALITAMTAARVGGTFWDPMADPWQADAPDNAERALIARLRAESGDATARATLAHEILIARTAYRDPFTGAESTPEATIALLGFWRSEIDRNPGHGGQTAVGAGIAGWKRRQVRQLLWGGSGSTIRFARSAAGALRLARGKDTAIIGWPARTAADLPHRARSAGIAFHRIEDGFIRSVGLGAECHPPFSIVLDRQGAHYDPSIASDLETLLATAQFTPELCNRADALIALIVAARISKYESGGEASLPPRTRRRVLVTGQVEDDMSVLLGGGGIASNLDLLRRARAAEPDAEIWFKPHPDVDAGHRKGRVADRDALAHADQVIRGVPMAALFDAIDAIHVLTSLAGFEALLRGIEVTTHGVPFYAGWGLTRDLGSVPDRRHRALRLNELAAGVLLLYPRYLDPATGLPCPPETLITRLSEQIIPQRTWLTRLRHLQGRIRSLINELRA